MAKKRETAPGTPTPGNENSGSGMPEMRRTDPSGDVTDIPGVGGLSGVRPNHSDGEPKEVPVLSQGVVRGPVKKDIASLGLEEKIGLLNALRDLLKTVPKVKDKSVQSIIDELYRDWVCSLMDRVLNNTSTIITLEGEWTANQLNALRSLANTIISRQQGIPAPVQLPQAQPAHQSGGTNPNPQNAAPMVPRSGLEPGANTDGIYKAQVAFLQELQKLDQTDPDAKWRTR